jgi:hypothetical protein
MLGTVRRKSAVGRKVPASKAAWECGKLNRPVAGSKGQERPAPRDGGHRWGGGRDRADRRLEMATRSDNRGLPQSFRTAGAHEQADPTQEMGASD